MVTFSELSRLLTFTTLGLAMLSCNLFGQATDNAAAQIALKKLTLEQLMNLEVTSVSRQPEPYGQAPASIQVITGNQIRRSGATSIPEALRLADNLTVAQKNSSAWAISARGFNTDLANKLLVLIDGRTVYTPLFSGVFWDRQNYLLEDIDRIEVISGPGGSLWGANAVNGVINIITKSARDAQGVYLEAGGGTQLRDFTGVRYGGKLASNVYFRAYGKYFDRDNEFFPNGNEASDSWRKGQGGFRIDAESSLKNSFTLQGDLYSSDEHLSTGGKARASGGNILGRWSHAFSEESDMTLQIYYDRTNLATATPAQVLNSILLAPAGTLKDDLDTFDVDFQHRFRLGGRNHVVWGLGYRATHDVVGNAPSLAFVPPVLNQDLFSGFVQDEIRLSESVAFTFGTKLEHNDYTGLEVEPSARLQWNATTSQTVWGAVSRAVRAPSRVDRDERLPTPGFAPIVENLLIGGANFASENVIAYELGYRAQLGPAVSGSISTFYNNYDDVRSTSPSPPDPIFQLPFPFFFENNLKAKTYGVELSANYQALDWWQLHSGYRFLHENIFVKPGEVDFNNALNETADPKHQWSLRSSMDLPQNLELDAGLRWVGSFRFSNGGAPARVPSYVESDVRLAWHPSTKLEFSAVGQNLLHDQHLEYAISSPNPREEIGRSVYGKVAIRW